jgi:hypothetical protein
MPNNGTTPRLYHCCATQCVDPTSMCLGVVSLLCIVSVFIISHHKRDPPKKEKEKGIIKGEKYLTSLLNESLGSIEI